MIHCTARFPLHDEVVLARIVEDTDGRFYTELNLPLAEGKTERFGTGIAALIEL